MLFIKNNTLALSTMILKFVASNLFKGSNYSIPTTIKTFSTSFILFFYY